MAEDSIRINKFIAQQANVGRRAADDLITAQKVTINGQVAGLGARVRPGDKVTVNGQQLNAAEQHFLYILLDKPIGYVCSRRQQGGAQTIYSLLPPEYQHLKAVGRLDKDSSGVLLLTNDGDYAHQLAHPSFTKIKRYEATLDQPLAPLHRQMVSDHGILLPDGLSKLQLERLHEGNGQAWLVTMHEGRNRQIRRTFAALGYTVTTLRRIQFGQFSIHDLHNRRMAVTVKR